MRSPLHFIALSCVVGAYGSVGPTGNLYIGNRVISPDGWNRSSVLAGSSPGTLSFPGPNIVGVKGGTMSLNVINNLNDTSMLVSTSIHWHGMFQKGTSWADGAVGVTQCPIAPNHSFLYQFSTGNQAGTFWYHSHYSTQYCDGLRGALVIYDPNDPAKSLYDIDDESTIITLSEWYHTAAPSAGTDPDFDSTTINGLGRYPGGPASPLAVIHVAPNKRYRFRLVSISCDPDFAFSIDGHLMTIIEVDGTNVKPLVVDQIQIFAGQRFSFVLHANQPVSNYWIRNQPTGGIVGFDGGVNSAILRYMGAPNVDPTTPVPTSTNAMVETNLHPLTNPAAPGIPAPGKADVNINLQIGFDGTTGLYNVNGGTWAPPPVPVLLQILSGAHSAQSLLPAGAVHSLPPNKVIEISLPGGSADSPVRILRMLTLEYTTDNQVYFSIPFIYTDFAVVRSAGSSVYNYANPVRRDVVSIGQDTTDNVTIRFTTDNSGPWIMHCHINWHFEIGLALVFAENIPGIATSHHPPAWDQLCPTYDALPVQTFT